MSKEEIKIAVAVIEAEAEAKKIVEEAKAKRIKIDLAGKERLIHKLSLLALAIGSCLVLLAIALTR